MITGHASACSDGWPEEDNGQPFPGVEEWLLQHEHMPNVCMLAQAEYREAALCGIADCRTLFDICPWHYTNSQHPDERIRFAVLVAERAIEWGRGAKDGESLTVAGAVVLSILERVASEITKMKARLES